MPPHSCSVPVSRYWRIDSSVSCVISFEWSTGKMKFEAWPVEPPGFGNGPLSTWTRSVQPSSASQPAEAVADDAAADHDDLHTLTRTFRIARSKFSTWARMSSAARSPSADDDRLDQVAVRLDRLLEILGAVERDHPDPQREDVVLAERLLEQVVVRGGVDRAVDPLVEAHEVGAARDLVAERGELVALLVGRALGGEPGGLGLERGAHLRDAGEVAHVDAGHEHAAAGEDLDELLLREPPQRLPDRRAAEAEVWRISSPLVDHRSRAEARARR